MHAKMVHALTTLVIAVFLMAIALSAGAAAPMVVRVGIVGPVPDFFHEQVATPLNMWDDAGIKIKYIEFSSGAPMIEAFAAGELDMGVIGGPPVVFANTRFFLPVVAAWDASGIIEMWVRPEDAQRIQAVGEAAWFKGKSIGYTQGTTGHFMLQGYLRNIGLSPKDVKLVHLEPGDREQAFLRGDVNAVQSWFPPNKLLKSAGMSLLTTGRKQNITIPSAVVARAAFLERHPDVVVKFLDVHFRLIDLLQKDRDRFLDTQAKWFNTHGIKLSRDELAQVHGNVVYYDLESQIDSFSPKSGERLSYFGQAFQDMAAFFKENGAIKGNLPDFRQIVDAQLKYLKMLKDARTKNK
ncbi:MAG: ABC transporter substrate-binding protein [Bacillota bacterium]|nr:ABC transporter substrate-binding protein [Bacillota bacterium]